MTPATFSDKLAACVRDNDSLLCLCLDPEPDRLPAALGATEAEAVLHFNRSIVDATADLVCAYKPNLAFYEALGPAGMEVLRQTVGAVRQAAPGVPVIADAKRGDVANTARRYAAAMFDFYGFDAVTVSPYLGEDALAPFLARSDRGVFVLCHTSNPGAAELQDRRLEDGLFLFEHIALLAKQWNSHRNVGLVVGATYPEQLARVRGLCPDLPLLVPGIGPQGGDIEDAVRAGLDATGAGLLVSAARQVLYASSGSDFAVVARRAAAAMRDLINECRAATLAGGGPRAAGRPLAMGVPARPPRSGA